MGFNASRYCLQAQVMFRMVDVSGDGVVSKQEL
eukprot:COSAG06_NODE_37132_length_438_cov_223.029499_1_plen_32_part_10